MNCKQCCSDFNDSVRRPKLLPKCGDSICAMCLDQLRAGGDEFRCPADGIVYPSSTEVFDNAYLLNFLLPSKASQTVCLKHNKDLELHCIDCDIEICASCVLFGEHKHHNYEQLSEYRSRFAERLAEFQRRIEDMDRGVGVKISDLSVYIQRSRSEKLMQIDSKFEDLFALLTKVKNMVKDQVLAAFEGVITTGDVIRSKIKNLSGKIGECAKGKNRLKEDYILRELKDLETAYQKSDIFRGREAISARTELTFSRSVADALSRFVTVGRSSGFASTPKSRAKSKYDIMDEDNLLQESFKEFLKSSVDSPLEDSERPEERTPTSRVMGNFKNFSPLSNHSSGPSPRSLNAQKTEKNGTLLNQTLADVRKLSLSPTNNSLLARSQIVKSGVVITPFKSSVAKSGVLDSKENQETPTNLKTCERRPSLADRLNSQLESLIQGRSTIVDLSASGGDDRGLEALVKRAPDMKNCKTIKLNSNSITEQGLKYLLKSIKDLNVEYLFLNNNGLKETALDYIISFRKYNASMKCVYLAGNSISKSSSKTKLKLKLLEEGSISVSL